MIIAEEATHARGVIENHRCHEFKRALVNKLARIPQVPSPVATSGNGGG